MSRTKSKKPPAYRLHKRTGRAVTTFSDATTRHRRDTYFPGAHGSPESRAAYAAALAKWEAAGRILDGSPPAPKAATNGASIAKIATVFWESRKKAKQWDGKGPTAEGLHHTEQVLRLLRSRFGATPAVAFGPLRLHEVLEAMVAEGLARGTIKERMRIIRKCFQHAADKELIPVAVNLAIKEASPPAWRELGVPAAKKKPPAPIDDVAAVLPTLPGPLRALLMVVRLTACRCKEACSLTAGHFEGMTGDQWVVELAEHKGAHRGKVRHLIFNTDAQAIVRPLLNRPADAHLFSPQESVAEFRAQRFAARKTPLSCGNAPGRRSPKSGGTKGETSRVPGTKYTTGSVRTAIYRACDRLGCPRFSAQAVRRLKATEIEMRDGLVAAASGLGQGHATVTAAHYAAENIERAKHALRLVRDDDTAAAG